MSIYLKIKSKSLAAEARIIRRAEKKQRDGIRKVDPENRNPAWHSDLRRLHSHRTLDVRPEARATHLARAFIKGMPYKAVERWTREPMPNGVVYRVAAMVVKYGSPRGNAAVVKSDVWDWVRAEENLRKAG